MDRNFINVINHHLSISLKKVNIIDVKKSFTIDNYYDIDNTIIYPISGKFRFGKYKKLLTNDSALFIPAHNTVSLSFGSERTRTLAYEDFIDQKRKYLRENKKITTNSDKYLILNLDAKAYDLVNIFHSKNLGISTIEDNKSFIYLLNCIIKEVSNGLPGHQKVIESITNQVVFELIRNILSKQPLFSSIEENFKFFNDEKILDLFLFIDENISKDLSNKILSDHLNISEDYVGQFFRNNIGFSPQDYIEHRRMEKAIKILREKTDAIKVISNDVGFKDTAYFCRRFKMMFGVQAGKMKKRLNEI